MNGRSIHLAGLQPANVRLAEGRPIDFLIACEGVLPAQGKAKVSSSLRSEHTDLVLEPLSLDDRLVRLKNALQMAEEAQSSTEVDVAGQWYDDLAANLQLEAPEIWETLRQEVGAAAAGRRAKMIQKHLPKMQEQVSKLIADWPRHANQRQLFTASLPRLMEPVYYRLTLGDAYTDPAEIAMIPLPVVEAKVTPKPPAYAERVLALSTVGRQSAVLVGSEVKVELACTNHKPLKEAWITVRDADQLQRFDLKAMSEDRFSFQLATPNTPFHRIERELRYEIQVTDTDGLHLESPVQGIVRLRIDKPPVALVSTIHRVAIPTAKPRIQYRVGDDFGLKRLSFEVVVKRLAAESPVNTGTGDKPPAEKPLERTVFDMLAGKRPLTPEELPYVGKSSLDLSQLKLDPAHARLDKGDRLEVVLVAEDDRGDLPGEIFRTEPLVIEITDQAGLMDAVSEINPRAEQQFNEIIQREIGIGESP